MTLKGAKAAAEAKAASGKSVNQKAIDKARLRAHLENLSKTRQLNQKQLQWNLDSMSIP